MDALTIKEIFHFKKGFIEAANRAVKAGFDLIEFHAAHGYGLNQWLSPLTNKREDIYGGNIENNLRILNEIIIEVKKNHPEILIAVRMPGQDFIPSGLTTEDGIYIAQTLEKIGVDILDVSSGIGGWRRPRDRTQEGYLVPEASVIQRAVGIPVIGVGGIETESFIDELIASGKISLAAIGRAILSGQFKLSTSCRIVNFS
jgi:NADPH2 dehydrogenase